MDEMLSLVVFWNPRRFGFLRFGNRPPESREVLGRTRQSYRNLLFGFSLACALCLAGKAQAQSAERGPLPLDQWTYLEIDSRRTGRAFGLAMSDLSGDGNDDIVSGKYFYRSPGGNITGRWPRSTFPVDADALLAIDVDDDDYGDAIALDAAGKLYWLEAEDKLGGDWKAMHVGNVGQADHNISSQGYALGQLVAGGKQEIIINVGSIFYFQIPPKPDVTPWPRSMITDVAYPEGVGVGDVDRDGDVDICGTVDNKRIAWWENPGNGQNGWPGHAVGAIPDKIADRFYLADLNGDDRLDIVVSAANGSKNGVYWWEQLDGAAGSAWRLRTIVVQDTTNSMDVADMDSDGDIDVISGEHRGDERVAIWVNEGRGQFSEQVVWSGKESHLGTRVADLDGDGDFDIVSIAWDDPQFMHVWRNDAIATSVVKAPRAKK